MIEDRYIYIFHFRFLNYKHIVIPNIIMLLNANDFMKTPPYNFFLFLLILCETKGAEK